MAAPQFSKSNKHVFIRNSLNSRCWKFLHFDFMLLLGFIASGMCVFNVDVKFVLLDSAFVPKQPRRWRQHQHGGRPSSFVLLLRRPPES